MRGIDPENAHFAREERQLLQRAMQRGIVGVAVDVGEELRGGEFALDHVAFELGHVDAVGRETAKRLVQRGGDVADAEHESGDQGRCARFRNVPAALYKGLGGFATNGVNMTKLESYMVDGEFSATMFLADVDGHPDDPALKRALEELEFFSREVRILGVYPAHEFRIETQKGAE